MSAPRPLLLLALAGVLALAVWFGLGSSGTEAGSAPADPRAEALAVLAGPGGQDEAADERTAAGAASGRGAPRLSGVGAAEAGATGHPGATARPREAAATGPGRRAVTSPGAGRRKGRTWVGEVRSSHRSQPVAGAVVTLRMGDELSEATTDAEGVFRAAWFDGLACDLEIAHPELVDLRSPDLELEDDARFVLEPSGAIEGSLVQLPIGLAPGGQRVELWKMTNKRGRDWIGRSVEVDEAGSFSFGDLDPGSYALCAFGEGVAGRYESDVLVTSGARVRQDLACPGGGGVTGQLVGPDHLPAPSLEGCLVEVSTRDRDLPKVLAEERRREAPAAADGSFELDGLAPGAYRLTVTTPWGARVTRGLDLERSGELVELEIEVMPPASVAGRVVDGGGDPLSGMVVQVHRKKAELDLAALLMVEQTSGEGRATSDGDGHFLLTEVPAGEPILVLTAPTPEHMPTWSEALVLEPGEAREGLELRLPEGTFVRGRVERASATGSIGEHLEGARVEARISQAGREVVLAAAQTDEDGKYLLGPLLPRLTRLAVTREGYLPGSENIELVEGIEHAMDFQLQPAWTLRGRVVDESGAGVGPIRIAASVQDLTRPRKERRERTELDPPDRTTHTDEFGRFTLRELPPADWILSPRGGSHDLIDRGPRVVTETFVEAGLELELVVRRKAKAERVTLDLEVLALATGQPPEDLVVGGVRGGQMTIDGGEVHITGLEPGPMRLRLAGEDCASTYLDLELYEGTDLDLGLIQLEPGARVVVVVKDSAGKPVEKAKVRLLPRPPEEGGPVPVGGYAGAGAAPRLDLEHRGRGRYRVEGVPHGLWRLKVTSKEHRSGNRDVNVERDRIEVDLELGDKR